MDIRGKTKLTAHKQDAGFTIVEIAVAVTILGLAMSVLIGLQTRILDSYRLEQNLTNAALYAQYLMTAIEVNDEQPAIKTTTDDLYSKLNDAGFFTKDDQENLKEELKDWEVETKVTSIDELPIAGKLRRIEMKILWGKGNGENYNLEYYIQATPEEQTQEEQTQ